MMIIIFDNMTLTIIIYDIYMMIIILGISFSTGPGQKVLKIVKSILKGLFINVKDSERHFEYSKDPKIFCGQYVHA